MVNKCIEYHLFLLGFIYTPLDPQCIFITIVIILKFSFVSLLNSTQEVYFLFEFTSPSVQVGKWGSEQVAAWYLIAIWG